MKKTNWIAQLSKTIKAYCRQRQRRTLRRQLKDKEILTFEEACAYLDTEPGILLKEVAIGKLPGGKLGRSWHFSKKSLNYYFSFYHAPSPLDLAKYFEEDEGDSANQVCNLETIQHLLESYHQGQREFWAIDLRGAALPNSELPGIEIADSWLHRINLSRSNLRHANFEKSQLNQADLSGADLSHASFEGADLSGANLSQANLTGTQLHNAILTGVNLSEALIQNTCF